VRAQKGRLVRLFCCAGLLLAGAATAKPLVIEIVAARTAYDTRSKEPLITFKKSGASKKTFTDLTRANVGHKWSI
jgi:hypothetical protein